MGKEAGEGQIEKITGSNSVHKKSPKDLVEDIKGGLRAVKTHDNQRLHMMMMVI